MYLTLPIPPRNRQGVRNGPVTVFECLESFLETEKLTGDDQWKCPRCNVKRDATKSLAIVKLPTVLLIHLKRFSFSGPFRDKLETPVDFPIKKLDMTPYTKITTAESQSYGLCGVSVRKQIDLIVESLRWTSRRPLHCKY
jgi:ubiquitin C-terminal hydrolase